MLKNGRTTFASGAFEPRSKSNSEIRKHRGSNSVSFGSKRRRFGLPRGQRYSAGGRAYCACVRSPARLALRVRLPVL